MRQLEDLSNAAIDPQEAMSLIKSLYAETGDYTADLSEAVYEALRSVAWQFATAKFADTAIPYWSDLILRVRAYLRPRDPLIAERLTALFDMLDMTYRYNRPVDGAIIPLREKHERRRRERQESVEATRATRDNTVT